MNMADVIAVVSGCTVFLLGIHMMGEGLAKLTGGYLERVLENVSDRPLKTVMAGAGVTAVLQSSAAVTVMVVGFVNAGILKLSQTVGIILGANVGTTVTAWILGMSGIRAGVFSRGNLLWTALAALLSAVGIILMLYIREGKKKDIGTILMGFSLSVFGMTMMQYAIESLAYSPGFQGVLMAFTNPVLGMLTGAVITALIRSSTVSVGLLQVLSVTGAITFGNAFPVLVGQNIGACVPALISSMGTSKNARRAAMVHLYFNLFGMIFCMSLFYGANALVQYRLLTHIAGSMEIAALHSLFNLITAAVLLPFSHILERMACGTVKDISEEKKEQCRIDRRFLEKPAFAVEQSRHAAVRMGQISRDSFFLSADLIGEYQAEKAEKIEKLEKEVDRYEDRLREFLVKLGRKSLTKEDHETLSILLHCIRDFERITDCACNIMKTARKLWERDSGLSGKAEEELKVLIRAVKDLADLSVQIFSTQNLAAAREVEPLKKVIEEMSAELKKRHIRRLRSGTCSVEQGAALSDILWNLERVSDHCSSIAVCVTQVKEDIYDTHEYLDALKYEDYGFFRRMVLKTQEKYLLP